MIKINHNGQSYQIPASEREISLKQVQLFTDKYGKDLELIQSNADQQDELLNLEIKMDAACKSVSFFSGIPLDQIQKTDINQVITIYQNILEPIFNNKTDRELSDVYHFNNKFWKICSPELSNRNEISFIELITGKEITRDLQNFANGKWDAIQRLACVYLREFKDGKVESFDELWLNDDSERLELMAELPMDIALDVAFFLMCLTAIYQKTFQYSNQVKENQKDQI